MNGYEIVNEFEDAVAAYTGAPFAVAVNSCSMALFLVLQWYRATGRLPPVIEIPKLTYVSVPMAIMHAGAQVVFRDEDWQGVYRLSPLGIYDAARRFTGSMFLDLDGSFVCTSHHWNKPLGIQQGGMILTDNHKAVHWLRRARFDGRTEGVPPGKDTFDMLGWHAYMSPEIAAEGLVRLAFLPDKVPDLPRDNYPDLSKAPIFRGGPDPDWHKAGNNDAEHDGA